MPNHAHHYDKWPGPGGCGIFRKVLIVCFVSALALAAAFGLSDDAPQAGTGRSVPAPPSIGSDPYRYMLNALLVTALDSDALPLRWVDPRPILGCGPDTSVRVNQEPLLAGALVPDMAFEIEWHANGCRFLGAYQTRFDGEVKLTVFREDWGFSAMVDPKYLRLTSAGGETLLMNRGSTWLPQCADAVESDFLTLGDDPASTPCR